MVDKTKIWSLLKRVPRGKVTTYAALAKAVDTSPRGVGAALHSNPDPDSVPCYKVVMSDGRIGGFGRGVEDKTRRLERDGIRVKRGRIVDFEYVFHRF
jgi:methylated-DNA-[protein]-cysteine S-methyltransferase